MATTQKQVRKNSQVKTTKYTDKKTKTTKFVTERVKPKRK
jgi:hypothetical protein